MSLAFQNSMAGEADFTRYQLSDGLASRGMSSTGTNAEFDCIANSPVLLNNLDAIPSHLLPQLQTCASKLGYSNDSFEQSGPSSLVDGLVMPDDSRGSVSSLDRHDVASMNSYISPVRGSPDARSWSAEFPSHGASASGESVFGNLGGVQQAASRSSDRTSPDSTVKCTPETSERKPKKHWSSVQRRRVPHHVIERRYRDNLNGQIEKLRTCIPSLATDGCSPTSDMEDDPMPVKCPSKASVIVSAQAYIKELEEQQARLQSNTRALREQVTGLQKLVRCDDCSVVKYFNSLQLNGSIPVQ